MSFSCVLMLICMYIYMCICYILYLLYIYYICIRTYTYTYIYRRERERQSYRHRHSFLCVEVEAISKELMVLVLSSKHVIISTSLRFATPINLRQNLINSIRLLEPSKIPRNPISTFQAPSIRDLMLIRSQSFGPAIFGGGGLGNLTAVLGFHSFSIAA